jgi:hypothetical protein
MDPDPDPTPFFNDFKVAEKIVFFIVFSFNLPSGILSSVLKIKFFAKKFCDTNLFCKHYFSLLDTFMRERKDPEEGSGSILMTNESGSGTGSERLKNLRIQIRGSLILISAIPNFFSGESI